MFSSYMCLCVIIYLFYLLQFPNKDNKKYSSRNWPLVMSQKGLIIRFNLTDASQRAKYALFVESFSSSYSSGNATNWGSCT